MKYNELKKRIEAHRASTIADYSEEMSAAKASKLYDKAWENGYDEVFELINDLFESEKESET